MASSEYLDLQDDVSQMDLVSWTFANLENEDYEQGKKIYINADDPCQSISASEAQILVRKLVAGFKAVGLQPGDCVCVHAFNNVRTTYFLNRVTILFYREAFDLSLQSSSMQG